MRFAKGSVPANFKDMTGRRFGMLKVIARAESRGPARGPKAYWLCQCECGNELAVSGDALRQGQHSCGCVSLGLRTHGMSETRVYSIWQGMIQRCTNPKNEAFVNYGARGISVCDSWMRFENFLADMGEPPDGHSIERRDNNAGYDAGNCYWLPLEKQPQNRRGNLYVELNGETVCVAEAARRLGVKSSTIRARLKRGVRKRDITAPIGREIMLTCRGETLSMKQWSERLGIARSTISVRHKKGWSVERILEAPE